MTTAIATRTTARESVEGLAFGVIAGLFSFVVCLGLSGELGRVLRGIVQADVPAGGPATSALRWALAASVTVAVLAAPLRWHSTRTVGQAWLAAIVILAAVASKDAATWAVIALPAAVCTAAYLSVTGLRWRQEPLRRAMAAPLPQLSWSLALATVYGMGALVVVLAA